LIVNLRRDPYERFHDQASMHFKWWADRMYVMVPAQVKVAEHLKSLEEFPPARDSSLSLGKILDSIQYAKPGQ
jgi:hypothetical protein